MKIDEDKFCSDIIIGGVIMQGHLLEDEQVDADYLLLEIHVPIDKNIFGELSEDIFHVKVCGRAALRAVSDICLYDYVKIKVKFSDRYCHWNGNRVEIIVDEPEQILIHEPMKVSDAN